MLRPQRFQTEIDPGPVQIGENVWIGAMALVLPGAVIGHDSVIAARSVVSGFIPSRCLAMGSPAKVVREL